MSTMRMKPTALLPALIAGLLTLGLLGIAGCKGHVERDAQGDVTSVGVKTDPKTTEAAKEAGEKIAETGKAAGENIKEGAEKAGDAIANGTEAAGDKMREGADKMAAASDDAAITAKVKEKLIADPEVGGLKIHVDTTAGRVTLTGTAETAYQKGEAGKLARHTDGVREVVNNIEVKPS